MRAVWMSCACAVLLTCMVGCDDAVPEGTKAFTVVSYKMTGVPYAAWASDHKVSYWQNNKMLYGYDDSGEKKIFEEKLDSDEPNDTKTYECKIMDVSHFPRFYVKYRSVWRGKAPKGMSEELIAKIERELQSEKKKPEPELATKPKPRPKAEAVQVKSVEKHSETSSYVAVKEIDVYTYKVKRQRCEDFKYRYVVYRDDGIEVIKLDTEIEANRLIPFLK